MELFCKMVPHFIFTELNQLLWSKIMKRMYNGVEVTYQNETDYLQSNVVYLITFPDGKYYVGSTTRRLYNRISFHCTASLIQHKSYQISLAISKFMKFDIKILVTENDKNKLRKLEEFYTIEYKSNEIELGYNWDCGCIKKFTDKTKKKMSESQGHCCFDDFNNNFESLLHASNHYKCSISYVCYVLKSGKKSKKLGTGFHYV